MRTQTTETTGLAGADFADLPTAPAEIDLGALLERRARASAERPAVTWLGRTLTFAEVHDRVRRLAQVLRDGGVRKGDRVAYLGLNDPAILEACLPRPTSERCSCR
jgi:fatty-acyl-CoA synthase